MEGEKLIFHGNKLKEYKLQIDIKYIKCFFRFVLKV